MTADTADTTTTAAAAAADAKPAAAAEEAPVAPSTVDHVIGVDLGTRSAVLALTSVQTLKNEILRNALSNQLTPCYVGFNQDSDERLFGELSEQVLTSNKNNTVYEMIRAVGSSYDDFLQICDNMNTSRCEADGEADNKLKFNVTYQNEELSLHPEQVTAMFLSRLRSYSQSKMEDNTECRHISLVIPDHFDFVKRQSLRNAAKIADVNLVQLVTRSAAAMMVYGKRNASLLPKRVMLVDVGHGYITGSIYLWKTTVNKADKDLVKKEGYCLATTCSHEISSSAIDHLLFHALAKQAKEKYKVDITIKSKAGIRLLKSCRKLKETLSSVPEASVSVENVLDGGDASFKFTRKELETICQPLKDKLVAILENLYSEAVAKDAELKESLKEQAEGQEAAAEEEPEAEPFLKTVELIGGGTYTPWIKQCIQEVMTKQVGSEVALAYTLDSMSSASIGAGLFGCRLFEPKGAIRRRIFDTLPLFPQSTGIFGELEESSELAGHKFLLSEDSIAQFKALEQEMFSKDLEIFNTNEARNQLESYLYEMRNLITGRAKHNELIQKEAALPLLDEVEEWLYDESAKDLAVYTAKFDDLKAALTESFKEYHAKVSSDKAAMEEQLRAESEKAKAELEAEGGKEDHDFRKLKTPDRMRKMMMNKDEGNGLFKDGNFDAAILRYIRALQHSDKFFDLSPDEREEVDKQKLSIFLNQAQCYLKLGKFDEVVKQCAKALELDGASGKALYRRAMALEKTGEYDKAKKDILKALKISPDDKAVAKLNQRIDAQLKRQKAKAAKMAKKMFG